MADSKKIKDVLEAAKKNGKKVKVALPNGAITVNVVDVSEFVVALKDNASDTTYYAHPDHVILIA